MMHWKYSNCCSSPEAKVPAVAVLNPHVNMAAEYQGKEMVRLESHVIFLYSDYIISLGTIFYELTFFSL